MCIGRDDIGAEILNHFRGIMTDSGARCWHLTLHRVGDHYVIEPGPVEEDTQLGTVFSHCVLNIAFHLVV